MIGAPPTSLGPCAWHAKPWPRHPNRIPTLSRSIVMRCNLVLIAGCLVFVIGCDSANNTFNTIDSSLPAAQDRADDAIGGAPHQAGEIGALKQARGEKPGGNAPAGANPPPGETPVKRRI